MKKCEICNKTYDENVNFCETCGRKLITENENNNYYQNENQQQPQQPQKPNGDVTKKGLSGGCIVAIVIVGILGVLLLGIILIGFFFGSLVYETAKDANYTNILDIDYDDDYDYNFDYDYNTDTDTNKKYKVNQSFKFDDLEITISDKYSFETLDNQFSEHNGKAVIKIPVTVKNLKSETHTLNMFYYNFYSPSGTETIGLGAYYYDTSIDYAGKLKTGASHTKYFYVLYDGDGTYTIELDDWTETIEVDIAIKKN